MKFPMVTPRYAIVQETSPTYAEATLKFLTDKSTNIPADSPAFTKTRGTKVGRYSALIAVVKRLQEERKLSFQPTFMYPVISSLGFMNKDMTELTKSIVQRFKDYQKLQPATDEGVAAKFLTGRFRVRLRNSICFALVRGNALAMHNQGVNGGVVKPP